MPAPKKVAPLEVLYELADIHAVRAWAQGEATPEQQRRAFQWTVRNACGVYGLSYRPGGHDGDRETAFAEGRRFAGLQLIKFVNMTAQMIEAIRIRKGEHGGRTAE